MQRYYDSQKHMERVFDRIARKNALRAESLGAYEMWKKEIQNILWKLLGMDQMEACRLEPVLEERVEVADGIFREKVVLQTEPDVWMPLYILIPETEQKRGQRCLITPPGHQGGGKYSVAGYGQFSPGIADKIEQFHYDYGMQLAKRGYVALCNDTRGFGERREKAMQKEDDASLLGCTCYHLSHMAEPLGQTVAGMITWDLMRLLDYIEQRGEWDVEKIGCLGFSGGGMQTLWLSALDDRIAYAIISGYMYGYKDSLLKLNGNCNCNYVPHLWEHVDMGDIGALIAPRPVMIQSCRSDHLNGERGIQNVLEQVMIMRQAYRLYEKEELLFHDICEGGHQWHEEHLDEFLGICERNFLEKLE